MQLKEIESGFLIVKKEELSLSNKALAELLQTTCAKGVLFRFRARGFSMSPFIRDNDVVTISSLSNSLIPFGKPVAFVSPETGKLVIHRVVGKKGNCYLVKGDSSHKTDGLIPSENILGVVTKVEREGKRVLLGFGLERFIIVFLSQERLLSFIFWGWRRLPISFRKFVMRRLMV